MLQSKFCKLLPAVALAVSQLAAAHRAPASTAPLLPVLNWQQRSDWINVKTGVQPAAVGDGVHDDTTAIQAALNRLDNNYVSRTKTVYFPPGTYRITKTLTLTKNQGVLIVGQGQTTRIVWDGALNQTMYWSNGVTRSRYIGLTWDGANKAAVGVDQASKNYYESRIRHQDEAFLNFRIAGIRVGYNQVTPTAEMMFRNCLFQKCSSGVSFLEYNDCNNDFEGCDFRDCGVAINSPVGQVYVRDSHFERSLVEDILLGPIAHSVRRCTSVGSRQFLALAPGGNASEVVVQDCHVDGWTGSQGAMAFGLRGPTTVFDCSFTHPPDAAPPIRLNNPLGCLQSATISNNTASASSSVIDPGPESQVMQIPAGTRGPSLSDPTKSLFISSETAPPSVLDVKTGFGARGDGLADDTQAILNAIHAAASQGGSPLVYLPPGVYLVSATLPVTGGCRIGGSGTQTIIHWSGSPSTGPVFSVQDPQNGLLEQISVDAPDSVACVRQTSASAAPSSMTYDGVYVGGSFLGSVPPGGYGIVGTPRANRGLECVGLPGSATVHLLHWDGSMHLTNCSRATILSDFGSDGVLQVDGSQYEKSGFLGVLMRSNAGTPCDIVVKDNQDFVGANMYTEATTSWLSVSGDGGYPGQPGHVTVEGSECDTINQAVTVDDYEGRVTVTGMQFIHHWQPGHVVVATGTRPVDILLLGDMFWIDGPTLQTGLGTKFTLVENLVAGDPSNDMTHIVPDHLDGMTDASVAALVRAGLPFASGSGGNAALADVASALDDFRLLGAVDLAINHPQN